MSFLDYLKIRNCRDCNAKPGKLHDPGCDVERCSLCGGQAISCDCVYSINGMDRNNLERDYPEIYGNGPTDAMSVRLDSEVERYGGRLPWTGMWFGTLECIELGWYSKLSDSGWVSCEVDDPEAGTDLNRFITSHIWNKETRKWVLRTSKSDKFVKEVQMEKRTRFSKIGQSST